MEQILVQPSLAKRSFTNKLGPTAMHPSTKTDVPVEGTIPYFSMVQCICPEDMANVAIHPQKYGFSLTGV